MEFSKPPGPHERAWRHPAEVAAEQRAAFRQTGPPVGLILGAVGGVGVLIVALTVLIAFAAGAPYRPVSSLPAMSNPSRESCAQAEPAEACAAPTGSIVALVSTTIVIAPAGSIPTPTEGAPGTPSTVTTSVATTISRP